MNLQADLREDVDSALSNCDALMLPTLPIPAPVLGAETVRIGDTEQQVRSMMLRETQLFNLTGHPAILIPAARRRRVCPGCSSWPSRADWRPIGWLACENILT